MSDEAANIKEQQYAGTAVAIDVWTERPQYMIETAENGYVIRKLQSYPQRIWIEKLPINVANRIDELLTEDVSQKS